MITKKIKTALIRWVAADTWHTGHPTDEGRFYDFVKELCDAKFMDEGRLRELITEEIRTHHPAFDPNGMERRVDKKVMIAREIYDYIRHVG